MGIGLMRGTVAVEPHSPEWDEAGRQTAARLKLLLEDAAADIQHVGSTAVRSICAKPIIDLAVGVTCFDAILSKNESNKLRMYCFVGAEVPAEKTAYEVSIYRSIIARKMDIFQRAVKTLQICP